MADTRIAYVDKVWNPVTGCSPCSPGCDNCYAAVIAKRFWGKRKFSDVQCHADRLEQPLHWRKPCRILVPSMGDLFHEKVQFEFIEKVFDIMIGTGWHNYFVLTKRIDNASKYIKYFKTKYEPRPLPSPHWSDAPNKNIWLGVSVCNHDELWKIDVLGQIPAAHRWVSFEPLLESTALHLSVRHGQIMDWGVVGCESGASRRFCDTEWIQDYVDVFEHVNKPLFVKQMEVNGKVVHDLKDMPEWAKQDLANSKTLRKE